MHLRKGASPGIVIKQPLRAPITRPSTSWGQEDFTARPLSYKRPCNGPITRALGNPTSKWSEGKSRLYPCCTLLCIHIIHRPSRSQELHHVRPVELFQSFSFLLNHRQTLQGVRSIGDEPPSVFFDRWCMAGGKRNDETSIDFCIMFRDKENTLTHLLVTPTIPG